MPLEVVVELHIRAISCPGVFLPDKESVYLGVYLLNQYLETDCFRSMFPIEIQQSMRFEKVPGGLFCFSAASESVILSTKYADLTAFKKFENAIDPGAVAEILESFLTRFELIQLVSPVWEELAYYEENTRNFLFPEPKLTSLHLGLDREVLMKTAIGFPGIAPKLEFSTRTAIRECMCPLSNRFFEDNCKSQRLLFKSQRAPTNYRKMKPKEKSPDRLPKGNSSRVPTPSSPRRLLPHQPTPVNFGKSFGLPGERKPPFVVRHVDSENPFGESNLDHLLQKSRRKSKFFDFDIPVRRASSLESLATNIKVTREPDERILLRNQPPSPLDSRMSEKPIPSHQGDADFHLETPFSNTPRHSRSPSPLDKPPLQERSEASTHPLAWFQPHSQSTWEKIHESVCSLLTSHRAHPKEDFIPETNYICSRPSCPMKTFPQHGQRYF